MSFMEQEIEFGEWFIYENEYGETVAVPHEYMSDVQSEVSNVVEQRTEGYGARMSAPGYIDCTEWIVFGTEEEAQKYLDEYYGDEEDSDE